MKKRNLLKMAVSLAAAPTALLRPWAAFAQPADVKIGLITPLSGPYARQGDFMRKGAELAVDHINAAGGIKALNGAKVQLIVEDAGDSTEKAKNAAQRMVAEHPDLVGVSGAWLSSYTLAVSEVTERAGLPLVTVSFADQVSARGFQYLFQTSASASAQAKSALPAVLAVAQAATGSKPTSVAALMDNTASSTGFFKGMSADSGFEKLGLSLKMEEVYTPPLADASSVVQKIRSAHPQLLLLLPSTAADCKLVLDRLNEVGLGSRKLPIVANGAHMGSPDLLKILGKDQLEGIFVVVANWGAKGQEKVIADFTRKTGEPWMPQDAISTYGDIWFFKEAIEQAGTANRAKVFEAMKNLKKKDEVARYYAGNTLQFDATGKRVGAQVMVLQWQDGQPKLVYPPEVATAKARWPRQS